MPLSPGLRLQEAASGKALPSNPPGWAGLGDHTPPPGSPGPALPAVSHFRQLRTSTPSQSNSSLFYLQEFNWILSNSLVLPFPFQHSHRKDKCGLVGGGSAAWRGQRLGDGRETGNRGTDREPESKESGSGWAVGARERQLEGVTDEETGWEGQDRREDVGASPARCRPRGPGQVADLPPGGCWDPQPTPLDTQGAGQGAATTGRRPHL